MATAGATSDVGGAVLLTLVLAIGGWQASQGDLDVGALVAAFALVNMLLPAVARLVDSYSALQGARVALDRIRFLPAHTSYQANSPLIHNPFESQLAPVDTIELAAKNITFGRGPNGLVFEALSFRLLSGRLTALLGPSGSGKSTLVRVLAGDLPAQAGTISLNGRSSSEIPLDVYRHEVVVVTDASKIFGATLKENLLVGRLEPAPEFVSDRLGALGLLHFFDRFPRGFDTILGESGRRISSGERQIIGLARALLFSPSVLSLDEAANAIDPLLSIVVSSCIAEYSKEHAVCVITHDPRTAREASYIYVMDGGRIMHHGPNDKSQLRVINSSPKPIPSHEYPAKQFASS